MARLEQLVDNSPNEPESEKLPERLERHAQLPPQDLPLPANFTNLADALQGQVLPTGQPNLVPTQVTFKASYHRGILPPAVDYKAYKEAHEPAAEWILAEATKSSDHFREMEKIGAKIAARDALLFRILPFAVVVVFLIVFTTIAFLNVYVGSVGVGVTLSTVLLAYLKPFGVKEKAPETGPTTAGEPDNDPQGAQ